MLFIKGKYINRCTDHDGEHRAKNNEPAAPEIIEDFRHLKKSAVEDKPFFNNKIEHRNHHDRRYFAYNLRTEDKKADIKIIFKNLLIKNLKEKQTQKSGEHGKHHEVSEFPPFGVPPLFENKPNAQKIIENNGQNCRQNIAQRKMNAIKINLRRKNFWQRHTQHFEKKEFNARTHGAGERKKHDLLLPPKEVIHCKKFMANLKIC